MQLIHSYQKHMKGSKFELKILIKNKKKITLYSNKNLI